MAAAGLGLTVTGARATVTFARHSRAGRAPAGPGPAGRLPAVAAALAAVDRILTGATQVVVLRGDVWSMPTPARLEPAASPAWAQPVERTAAIEEQVAAWQAAFGWLSDRADLVSVAAVDGPASGAGLQLALSCDLRVVTEGTTLALPETADGLVPGLGATGTLVGLLGYPAVLDLCLTGRPLTATEALAASIAQRVVPAASLDRAVEDLVAAILATPRAAASETKALLRGAGALARDAQRAAERAALARCLAGHPAG